MKSLTEIANSYGTDKGTQGPSLLYGAHNYTDIYEAYMNKDRDQEIKILEIGIGVDGKNWKSYIAHGKNKTGGGSIKMWFDYFKKAKIYAVDINPASFLDNERVTTYIVDQGDLGSLNDFLEKTKDISFDYIIDDGSHKPDHQQLTLSLLFPRLKSGGVYFIEDLENNGLGDFEKGRNSGRHKSTNVYNTRKIFRSFLKDSKFISPNAFLNSDFLLKNIDSVIFYAPIHKIILLAFWNKLIGRRGMLVQYKDGSDRICAIKKK
jgi:hypothetical protein